MTEAPALASDVASNTSGSVAKVAVFISYSRKDSDAAQRLVERLEQREFDAYLDKNDIMPGEAWQDRLSKLIEAADTVVLLISPQSVSSPVCDWEVNEAERLGKRLLPVVICDPEPDKVPSRLKRLNYIFMRDAVEEGEALGKLRAALLTDIGWIRQHTRVGELAEDWHANARLDERLLRGTALTTAELWLTNRPREAPEATMLQREYVQESRRAEQAAMANERNALRAMQRRLVATAMLLSLMVVGLVGWLNQAYLLEQYQWRVRMKPFVLSAAQGKDLHARPGKTFSECWHGCPTMVVIPAGSFMMGEDTMASTRPRRRVTIARPLAVARTELTFEEWDACAEIGPCVRANDDNLGRTNKPVIEITWEEAKVYTAWLSRLTGRTYRLLTEAEWEYAARGIIDASQPHLNYPWGDSIGLGNANCRPCGSPWDDAGPAPIGNFKPNAFGLYHMSGNVWEWVEDNWHETLDGGPIDGSAWTTGGDQDLRVVRGGSWKDPPVSPGLRSAGRWRDRDYVRQNNIGFRIARVLD